MFYSFRERAAFDAAQRSWDNAEPPDYPDVEEEDEEGLRVQDALLARERDACS